MATGTFFTDKEMIESLNIQVRDLVKDNTQLVKHIKAVYPALRWDKLKKKLVADVDYE